MPAVGSRGTWQTRWLHCGAPLICAETLPESHSE
jgi:hypothetical protein